jgi:anhydro-N-acetylmuramic acid kinase
VSNRRELFIGVMSGTSLDGIDAVLADFSSEPPQLLGHVHHQFAEELRHELLALTSPGWDDMHRGAIAAQHLARAYAGIVAEVIRLHDLPEGAVRAIGAHGQTVRHHPTDAYTIQLNAPALLAELTQIDVVADFRSRDLAAGGQGAPLVPAFHRILFSGPEPIAIVNIGGIANLTALPAAGDEAAAVTGFDCGPGNLLMDGWTRRHLQQPFDRDGAWAAGGTPDAALLASFLTDPFFTDPPPKSTGREQFNDAFIERHLAGRVIDPRDVAATLTRLTAESIAQGIEQFFPAAAEVLLCGGGAFNPTLVRMLERACSPRAVGTTMARGVAPEHVEAFAFAWLAKAHLARQPGNVPSVTGAQGGRVLGALYPA